MLSVHHGPVKFRRARNISSGSITPITRGLRQEGRPPEEGRSSLYQSRGRKGQARSGLAHHSLKNAVNNGKLRETLSLSLS